MPINLTEELFSALPRQAPGTNAATRKALHIFPKFVKSPYILDLGCGTGLTSVQLAHQTGGKVTAVDISQTFLDQLKLYAQLTSLSDRVETHCGSMDKLPFKKESFDLLWSEGAVYVIGFEKGLSYWHQFLKKDGYACVSELTWLSNEPPDEPKRFWKKAYPAMQDIRGNLNSIAKAGYKPIDQFILPALSWWENYYGPLEKRIDELRGTYSANPDALQALKEHQAEINLFKNHADAYGYVFYAMQKA
jgi:ubiquinone/menaquinone biosynthesis C-methylase UbiE